jgi:large subunit ribosomal protein L31
MRENIHPDYIESTVHCSCGNVFTTHSTKSELHIELCNKCHPLYTGQQMFVDTGGRDQRFAEKFGGAAETVIARESAAKEARQKAHEEALATAKAARDARDAIEAEKARKAALRAPKAAAAPAAETEAESGEVAESAEVAEVAESADVPAAEDAPSDEPAAEDGAE